MQKTVVKEGGNFSIRKNYLFLALFLTLFLFAIIFFIPEGKSAIGNEGTCSIDDDCSTTSACINGACTDVCSGVVCNNPPPPSCINPVFEPDGTNPQSRVYSSSGSCFASNHQSSCSYIPTDTYCPNNCNNATGLCYDAPSVSLNAIPNSVNSGSSSTLSWSSSNADSCTKGGDWGTGSVSLSGTANVIPSAPSKTYTLTCSNTGASASKSATVTVTSPVTAWIDYVKYSSTNVPNSYIVSWGSTGATSCTASGTDWGGLRDVSGSEPEKSLSVGIHTYIITCQNSQNGNSASDSITINVQSPTCDIANCPGTTSWYCKDKTTRAKDDAVCTGSSCGITTQTEDCLKIDTNYICDDPDGKTGSTNAQCKLFGGSTTISCSPSPPTANIGQSVTFSMSVTPNDGTCLFSYGDGSSDTNSCSLFSSGRTQTYNTAGWKPSYFTKFVTGNPTAQCGVNVVDPNQPATLDVDSPQGISYGPVTVGSTKDLSFRVTNIGGGTLSGSASVSGTGFSCVLGCSYSLSSGQYQDITIRFSPSSVASYSGTATFTGGGGATRAVSGEGTSADTSGYNCGVSGCQFVSSGAQYGTASACQLSCSTGGVVCGNGVKEGTEQCDDGNTANGDGCSGACTVESGWTCNAASPNACTPANQCLNTGLCSDYSTQTSCNNDACGVGPQSAPSTVDCSGANTTCGCSWSTGIGACEPSYTTTFSLPNGTIVSGTCQITQDTTDDCSDGFLSFSWTGIWAGNPFVSNEKTQCETGGADTIPCPAQIQLPFFGPYNIAAVIALAIVIYLIISLRKKNSPKKKGSRKKR